MQYNNIGLSNKKASDVRKCAICDEIINEQDLVYISDFNDNELAVHFTCYVEIQEKICSECGNPFKNQERLLFCEEHNEYFHKSRACIRDHLEKHMRFKDAIYDAIKNRITYL